MSLDLSKCYARLSFALNDDEPAIAEDALPAKLRIGGAACDDGKRFHLVEEFAGHSVISIKEDRRGCLWFGLPEKGLCCYDGQAFADADVPFTYLTTADGLVSNGVTALLMLRIAFGLPPQGV